MEEVLRVFAKCDKDGDGSLSFQELHYLLKSLGSFRTSEIKLLFRKLDTNGDGAIQYEEFLDWIFGNVRQDVKARTALMARDTVDLFHMAFYNYCPVGQTEVDGKSFAKLCKDANLLCKSFSLGDAGVIFARAVCNTKPRLSFEKFQEVVEAVADKKHVEVSTIREAIARCGQPQATDVQPSVKSAPACEKADAAVLLQSATTGMGCAAVAELSEPAGGEISRLVRSSFKAFCAPRPDLDIDGFLGICEFGGLFEMSLGHGDAQAIFRQVAAAGQSRISARQLETALRHVAERTGAPMSAIASAVAAGAIKREASSAMQASATRVSTATPASPCTRGRSCSPPRGRVGEGRHRLNVSMSEAQLRRPPAPSGGAPLMPGSPKATTTVPVSPDGPTARVATIFQMFCSGTGTDIDGRGWAKFCKDSGLLDKHLSPAEVDVIFCEVASSNRRMGTQSFYEALKKIALKKKTDVESLRAAILACNGPTNSGTVADYVRLYDDFIDRPTAARVAEHMRQST